MTPTRRLLVSTAALGAILVPGAALAAQPAPAQSSAPPAAPKKGDIVVTGNRGVVTSTDRVSFSVANDLQAQTGTVADALRSVPGVEVDPQGQVSLRGDPGVTILVDGRPSAMLNGESRGDVLMSMPAGQIDRVEVITNPSAAMSPEGSGGVINLVSKRVRKDSRSGTVRLTAGPQGRGGVNLNASHSGNGLTISGEAGFRRFTGKPEASQERSALDPESDTFVDSRLDSDLRNVMTGRTARVTVDYDLDKANRLTTEVNYRRMGVDGERSDHFVSDDAGASYDRESDITMRNQGHGARLGWVRTMAGEDHSLSADLEYEKNRFRRNFDAATDFASGSSFEDIRNAGDRSEYSAKLDYKRPLGKTASLNLGYEGEIANNAFDSSGARGSAPDALLPVASLTNRFDFDQTIHALFATHNVQFNKLSVQTGLRLEQVYSTIDQITDDVQADNDYFRAYPTLHLSYDLGGGEQLRGSFSRRIQRPSPQDLNPYTIYIDPLNLRRGNPSLRPQVTDSFEASWQKRKGGTFYSLTAFYRRSKDGVTDVVEDLGDGVFLTTRENLATANRVGLEATANGRFSKTMTYSTSSTLMWNEIDPRIGGVSDARSGTTASVRGTLNWQPSPKDYFQLNGIYGGKQLLPQGYRHSSAMFNLGYRRKVNERLSLLMTAQDVLDSAKSELVIRTPTIRDRITQTGFGRVLLFGLSYNFGGQSSRQREPGFDFSQTPADGPQ